MIQSQSRQPAQTQMVLMFQRSDYSIAPPHIVEQQQTTLPLSRCDERNGNSADIPSPQPDSSSRRRRMSEQQTTPSGQELLQGWLFHLRELRTRLLWAFLDWLQPPFSALFRRADLAHFDGTIWRNIADAASHRR